MLTNIITMAISGNWEGEPGWDIDPREFNSNCIILAF